MLTSNTDSSSAMQDTPDDSPVDLATKVAFLRRPDSYAERPSQVQAVETHMSWVFLTDAYAYKLKKPVRYPFLDFGTLEARRRDCEEEVRLNRRLAPDVYLGTVALTLTSRNILALNGGGVPIEWLVSMQRLPAELMLDQQLRLGRASTGALRDLARKLAAFYRAAPPVDWSAEEYRARLEQDVRSNHDQLLQPEFDLPRTAVEHVAARLLQLLHREPVLFGRRAAERRIVEAHGDLRPEHICLLPDPVVIDCLEFNRDFRLLDPVDELAFLAMECERLHAPFVSSILFEVYRAETGDDPPDQLVRFYASHRACLRAKLAVWHLRDAENHRTAHWQARAAHYLDLAKQIILM